ncbi:uncharacterized protein BT62DRAFT_1078367 [Guyanagaster necrorhizus]|uniref:Uncharacterized protein n=1 Tax=Guyanagaster necrorhizus TaxID=856835 RepID=A0A9P7VMV2_9AGAR|nr:uncharacterized protein BT62DRAFT_1078367 [Guyanagaster necrorhizus MCA 3950]KAG7443634.1 hypothetical protein BT62DRAFT_1078367 [Guyanagaster necrorhizus MCA 3950]
MAEFLRMYGHGLNVSTNPYTCRPPAITPDIASHNSYGNEPFASTVAYKSHVRYRATSAASGSNPSAQLMMSPSSQILQSFDPFATHPFTRYSTPPTPNAAPTFIQTSPKPSSPLAQKSTVSPSSAKTPASTSTSTSTSRIFTSYSGRQSPDPELDQILKKKTPTKNKS